MGLILVVNEPVGVISFCKWLALLLIFECDVFLRASSGFLFYIYFFINSHGICFRFGRNPSPETERRRLPLQSLIASPFGRTNIPPAGCTCCKKEKKRKKILPQCPRQPFSLSSYRRTSQRLKILHARFHIFVAVTLLTRNQKNRIFGHPSEMGITSAWLVNGTVQGGFCERQQRGRGKIDLWDCC